MPCLSEPEAQPRPHVGFAPCLRWVGSFFQEQLALLILARDRNLVVTYTIHEAKHMDGGVFDTGHPQSESLKLRVSPLHRRQPQDGVSSPQGMSG